MNKFSRRDEKDVMIFMLVVIFPLGSVVNLNILMSQNPLSHHLFGRWTQTVGGKSRGFLSISVSKRHFGKHKFTSRTMEFIVS